MATKAFNYSRQLPYLDTGHALVDVPEYTQHLAGRLDTGARDLTQYLLAGATKLEALYISRHGPLVHAMFAVRIAAGASGRTVLRFPSTGFKAPVGGGVYLPPPYGTQVAASLVATGTDFEMRIYHAAGGDCRWSATWRTGDDWPAVLPGVPL